VFKNKYLYDVLVWMLYAAGSACAAIPETVKFPSRDGKTELVGYLFRPVAPGPYPAVVMLHGRGGPYSANKPGVMAADNLTRRHRMWGEFWAARGYLALHVDSFGPRGHARGFEKHSYGSRPATVSEQTVRPLDAYGALDYLRSRTDVIADRIGLQGWSNGAMAVLAAIGPYPNNGSRWANRSRPVAPPQADFRAAIAQYPGCTVQRDQADYQPHAPLMLLVASGDDEVSPKVCAVLAERLKQRGADLEFTVYQGAHHTYDDPGKTRQSHAPNKVAMDDTLRRAEAFFQRHLKQ